MNLQTKVLICGAGPTGLMMACQLKRFGIDYIVVDEKPGVVKETRALTVQARTLLIYEQMGLAEKVLAEGTPAKKVKFIINADKVYEIPLQEMGKGLSAYPFLFVFTQDKNEQLLYDHLKGPDSNVLWQHSLESFTSVDTGIIAMVKDSNGSQKQISAEWLVGADGARSVVRHQLGVPFEGATYQNIFYVADTHVQLPWGHDCLSMCLSSKTFTGFFPMKGDDRFRLIGIFPKEFQQEEVTEFSTIQKTVEAHMGMDLNFTNTDWFSIYHIHHRCVSSFTRGRVFLAGDAAHVHSPAGGQGMNTGLQDAYNLAWKLAMVVSKCAGERLLESYNAERLPVAQELVKTTDRAFTILTSDKGLQKFFRLYIFPVFIKTLLAIKRLRLFFYKTISQLGINYSNSAISYSAGHNLLKAGALVPFVNINSKNINEVLTFNGFTIFLFKYEIDVSEADGLKNYFKAPMQIISIPRSPINEGAYTKFKVKDAAVFIIRPDNYIGFCAEKLSLPEIKQYLENTIHLTLNQ